MTTFESVLDAATRYLLPTGAQEIRKRIVDVLALANEFKEYEGFRKEFYTRFLRSMMADSLETIPAALGLFSLAQGDVERGILWSANFGRDSDTIATMVGGLCGALNGTAGIPSSWVAKVEANPDVQYRDISDRLAEIIRQRTKESLARADALESLE